MKLNGSKSQRRTGTPKSRLRFALLALAGLPTISCGEALVSGSSLDALEFSLSGAINPPPSEPATSLRLGLLWVDPAQEGKGNYVSASELVRDDIKSDGTYTLGLIGPPPSRAIRALKPSALGGTTISFAWGELILYEDRNADGTFAVGSLAEGSPIVAPDVYRGMPTDRILLYFADTLPPYEQVPPEFFFPVNKGYHVGVVRCLEAEQSPVPTPIIQEVTPPSAGIEAVMPSLSFPNLRSCLGSQPTPRDR